ncbi:uncharacterized protein LOC144609371 isoform X1 [Rhinoraja longicauda]
MRHHQTPAQNHSSVTIQVKPGVSKLSRQSLDLVPRKQRLQERGEGEGSKMSKLSKEPPFVIKHQELDAFLKLLDDDVIQDFLWMDSCCRIADKVPGERHGGGRGAVQVRDLPVGAGRELAEACPEFPQTPAGPLGSDELQGSREPPLLRAGDRRDSFSLHVAPRTPCPPQRCHSELPSERDGALATGPQRDTSLLHPLHPLPLLPGTRSGLLVLSRKPALVRQRLAPRSLHPVSGHVGRQWQRRYDLNRGLNAGRVLMETVTPKRLAFETCLNTNLVMFSSSGKTVPADGMCR